MLAPRVHIWAKQPMDLGPEPEAESEMDGSEPRPEEEKEDYGRLVWDVCGHTIRLDQRQQSGGGTGWRMWGSALVLAKYLEANAVTLLQPRGVRCQQTQTTAHLGKGTHEPERLSAGAVTATADSIGDTHCTAAVRVLDLSAGPGLLGLACAVIAAKNGLDVEVVLTEMPSSSLDQLKRNVEAVNAACRAELGAAYRPAAVAPFSWGEDVATNTAFIKGFDVVLVSDCLFIAVRPGVAARCDVISFYSRAALI